MTDKTATEKTAPQSVRERLAAQKQELSAKGLLETTLPESGEIAFYPAFTSHGVVMKAQRFSSGKKGQQRAPFSAVLVSMTCKFGSERDTLTPDDVIDLLQHADIMHLFNLVYSGEDDDDEGN